MNEPAQKPFKLMSRQRGPVPPVILLACIALAWLLHRYWPVADIIAAPWHWAGAALIALGIGIVVGPVRAFNRSETTIIPFQESSELVTSGLYRVTRNPMYVGMLSILLGVAVLTGSLSPFVAPLLFIPVMNRRVIRHEEVMLEERFGDAYREYKQRIRRWL